MKKISVLNIWLMVHRLMNYEIKFNECNGDHRSTNNITCSRISHTMEKLTSGGKLEQEAVSGGKIPYGFISI